MSVSLLPEKHVRTAESLLGIGALILPIVETESQSLDSLWDALRQLDVVKRRMHGSVTLDTVVLALDFLFAIGTVRLTREGLIEYAAT